MRTDHTEGNNQRVAPFKMPNPNQWITRSDMLHWIQTQKYHDEHRDEPGHWCDLCPVRIVFDASEDGQQ